MTNKCKICQAEVKEKVFFVPKLPIFVRAMSEHRFKERKTWPLNVGFCSQCGHLQQTSPPPESLVEEMYQDEYDYPSTLLTGIGAGIIDNFLSFLKTSLPQKVKNILEIGCFDGYLLKQLQDLGYRVIGCEPSRGAEIGIKAGIPIKREFFKAGLFDNNSFDLIIMRHLIEHIRNPLDFFRAIRSALRPGGLAAIETPNYQFSLDNVLWCDFHLEHLSFFTPNSLSYFLKKCGFEIVSSESKQMLYFLAQKSKLPVAAIEKQDNRELMHSVVSFQKKSEQFVQDIKRTIDYLNSRQKKIAIYGAGGHTTGLVVLANLKKEDIAYVVDSEESKWGKFAAGFSLPVEISPPSRLKQEPVDYVIPSSNWHQEDIISSVKKLDVKSGFIKLYPLVKIIEYGKA